MKIPRIICLSAIACLFCGCAVTVEYMVTEPATDGGRTVTHYVKYSRPIFVGQEIGRLSLQRDSGGHPTLEMSGQKSEASTIVEAASKVAAVGVDLAAKYGK